MDGHPQTKVVLRGDFKLLEVTVGLPVTTW